jgi:hypothetical protein
MILPHMAPRASAESRLGKWSGGLGRSVGARRPIEVDALRRLISEKLQDGRLPHERISRAQSGPADGQKCDACEKLTTMSQFVVTGVTLAGREFIQLHVQCFQLWDDERRAPKSYPLFAFTPRR